MPGNAREEEEEEGEEEEEKDTADPETLQMSQTFWEFKSLLKSSAQVIPSRWQPPQQPLVPRSEQVGAKAKAGQSPEVLGRSSKRLKVQSWSVNELRSGVKSPPPCVARYSAPTKITTTPLNTLKAAGNQQQTDVGRASATWDIFVLVLQCSGLQRITSKAGYEICLSTLLVADPTASFFRVTLWRRTAQCGARMIRAGDLVRLNRCARSVCNFSHLFIMSFHHVPGLCCHVPNQRVQYKVFVSLRRRAFCCRCECNVGFSMSTVNSI